MMLLMEVLLFLKQYPNYHANRATCNFDIFKDNDNVIYIFYETKYWSGNQILSQMKVRKVKEKKVIWI